MGFFRSIVLPLRAFALIRRTPALWRMSVTAAVLTGVTLLVLLVGLGVCAPDLLALLWAKPADGWVVVWYLASVVLFAVCFVIGAQALPALILAPLGDRLSAGTEQALNAVTPTDGGMMQLAADTARSFQKAFLRVVLLFAGQLVLLPLWLVPGLGQTVWSVLATLWSALWMTFEYVDITANRHARSFGSVLRTLRSDVPATVGFGAALYVLLFIPIVNAFFFPVAVVAGALFYADTASARIAGTSSKA